MNREALFSDGTDNFVIPSEPEANQKVTIRFRTGKDDADFVRVIAKSGAYLMRKAYATEQFDYYEWTCQLKEEPLRYCFEIDTGEEVCYYNRYGVGDEIAPEYDFTIVPGFAVPDWAKGAVMYQIFVDRFCNGDMENDVESGEYMYIGEPCSRVTDWNKCPAFMGVREFYGGDLQGVLNKLDYLQDLGVEVIYFNPLFVSPSNHKYDIQDYDYIDPHYGKIVNDGGQVLKEWQQDNSQAGKYRQRVTDPENLEASNRLFIRLVEEMHSRGMKVILDGVFNHCGSFNKWMDREKIYEGVKGYEPGAYISKDSPYRSFFRFSENEDYRWPYNGSYVGWWGHDTLPKLNYEDSRKLEEYMLQIGRKWVLPPYNADGWRLDVAADLGHSSQYNHLFWKKFRKAVKEANPDAVILAEHYGDPKEWLLGDEWDSVMNYDAFMEPVTWFLTGMEKHSDDYRPELCGNAAYFTDTIRYHMTRMLPSSLMISMNQLSNHDHSRFLTRTNHMVGRVQKLGYEAAGMDVREDVFRLGVVMQMTWIGAPTLYYGDEAGVVGFTDPDNRRTYPWGREKKELIAFHRDIIRIHKDSPALQKGSLIILGGDQGVVTYGRFLGEDAVAVAVNAGENAARVSIPVWRLSAPYKGRMRRILLTSTEGYSIEEETIEICRGEIVTTLPGKGGVIFRLLGDSEDFIERKGETL